MYNDDNGSNRKDRIRYTGPSCSTKQKVKGNKTSKSTTTRVFTFETRDDMSLTHVETPDIKDTKFKDEETDDQTLSTHDMDTHCSSTRSLSTFSQRKEKEVLYQLLQQASNATNESDKRKAASKISTFLKKTSPSPRQKHTDGESTSHTSSETSSGMSEIESYAQNKTEERDETEDAGEVVTGPQNDSPTQTQQITTVPPPAESLPPLDKDTTPPTTPINSENKTHKSTQKQKGVTLRDLRRAASEGSMQYLHVQFHDLSTLPEEPLQTSFVDSGDDADEERDDDDCNFSDDEDEDDLRERWKYALEMMRNDPDVSCTTDGIDNIDFYGETGEI